MRGRAGPFTVDAAVAACFVLAALGEALALHRDTPPLLVFAAAGAPLLGVLALRRHRPVLPICVIAAFATAGTTAQSAFWPDAGDGGGVWLFALMFASYSLGAHARGRVVALGGVLPLLTGLVIDVPTMRGWALVNGVLFLTAFVGVLPTTVGRLMKVRRDRLTALDEQRGLIAREQQAQRKAAVLAERLRTDERLRPALVDGLRALAVQAESGADAGHIEEAARALLARTREEVLALTVPVDLPEPPEPPPVGHLPVLREGAQRWTVLAAGAIGAGLALESTATLPLSSPAWVAVSAGAGIGLSLGAMWRRPLAAVAVTWCLAVAFSRSVAPLEGTLSGTAMTLAAAFGVAALSTRRAAFAGLALCLVGHLLGLGAGDPLGEGIMIALCWLGGLAVNEASRLVELGRANNRLLAGQEVVAQRRAVVEERLRLAREVHDQIGHSLTVVTLQAGAARRMGTTDPGRSRQVLATIAEAARDGLASMTGQASAELGGLLQRVEAAGLDVTADLGRLDMGALGAEVREAVYRTVQEALTNVLRHAPGASATVTARREADGVTVTIRNGPPSGPGGPAGSGRGLTGLRERVTACAGQLHWGPCEDGGFEVRALLPANQLQGARS